jgi:Uma2 family endonuclease
LLLRRLTNQAGLWYIGGVLEPSKIAPQEIRPLKRAEYERLVALGAFEDDRVELIRGNLVTMAPNDPEHANPIEVLTALFAVGLEGRARVRVQLPIVAADESEPEPDLAIVPNQSYSKAHPDRAHLVIEVAASSLRKDREVKAPLYAASGFTEYWLVSVPARVVEVYRDPSGQGYRSVTTIEQGSVLRPLDFPDLEIRVDALFE